MLAHIGCSNSSGGGEPPVTKYKVTVTNGTANPASAAANTTITIKADSAPEGKAFEKWTTSTEGVTFTDATAAETTFTMPARDVTVAANYKDKPINLDLSTVTADTVIKDNTIVTGTLAGNYKISIADGATITLKGATINGTHSDSHKFAGLTCAGDATIKLEDTNEIKAFYKYYPGIFVPKGKTLTIQGSGNLNASSGNAAGIGGCYTLPSTSGISIEDGSCGKIVIEGGTIIAHGGSMSAGIGSGGCGCSCDGVDIKGGTVTAEGGDSAAGIGCGGGSGTGGVGTSCGPISITGGTVTAIGGEYAAGVGTGSGASNKCGAITVAKTVTKFKASKGSGATNSVGLSRPGVDNMTCGAVTIGDTEYWDGAAYKNDGATVLGESPFEYPAATKYNVTVTNGTANPTSAKEGATVTITANAPAEGKAFDKWTTTSGVTFADENASSTTFVMPASAVTVEATYKDAPWDGDLSKLTAQSTAAFATATDGMTITGTLAANVKVSIADGATVTLKNASINADGTWTSGDYAGLNCLGDATITLEAGTTNTVKGFKMTYPGIHVPSGKTLTINGTGALTVSPNTSGAGMSATGAGIGGGVGLPCGNIVIAGGTITASTANHAAAIGSGGAGYGSGQTCGNISITGGTVTATCVAQYGAGIGAGINGECGNISITGGTVTASGSQSAGGAGIGCGGTQSTVGTITIADTVTKVTAVKGYNAKSIGKGFSSDTCVCGTITIGGTVYAAGISESPYTYPKIVDLSTITANTVIQDGYTVIGSTTAGKKIQIADGATVTLKNIDIKCSAYKVNGIECLGNAILILEGANKVETTEQDYAAIYAGPSGKTLTIRGDGSLTVKAYNYGAAIGSNTSNTVSGTVCGNITIESGTIVATSGAQAAAIGAGCKGQCGTIVISGGTVTANGCADKFDQWSGAGIGAGSDKTSVCGTITISGDNTKVTATRGNVNGTDCIGRGTGTWNTDTGKYERPTCGTVTIGGETGYKTEASYTYNPSGR